MTKKKKSKPVTLSNAKPAKKEKSHKIIGKLHQLNKTKELMKSKSVPVVQKKMLENTIKKCEEEIGGLETYQHLSKSAEKHHGNFNSAKWVWKELQALNLVNKEKRLDLLDVGALDLNYKKYSSTINATYIDLNPQVPGISKQDFFDFQVGERELFDVVVLSLVINFVGDPNTRGQMLRRAHQLLRPEGHLVVVLPLACVDNSRYLTSDLLTSMLTSLEFEVVKIHRSRKLVFFLNQKIKSGSASGSSSKKFPKKVVRSGGKMNNFCIVIS